MPHARSIIRAQTSKLKEPGSAPVERYLLRAAPRRSPLRCATGQPVGWLPRSAQSISSLCAQEVSAKRYAELVRGHWNIENGSHWQRDTLWREDAHQTRSHRRAHLLSTLRQVALHVHSLINLRSPTPSAISHLARQAGCQINQTIRLVTRSL